MIREKRFGRATVAVALLAALAIVVGGAAPAGAIVGGYTTTPDLHPHFVRLHVHKYDKPSRYDTCGGSVVDPEWILTAAHCLTGGTYRIRVRVAIHDTYWYDAVEARLHPLWNGDVSDGHDLALLRIPAFATSAHDGIPAATPVQVGSPGDAGAYAPGVTATVLGHGYTKPGGKVTKELRGLTIPLRSDADMDDVYNKWYSFDYWNEPLMIGAGSTTQTVCAGDSGGPLTVARGGAKVQVGVVSFGPTHWRTDEYLCNEPGGYAELSGPQLAWLAATVPGIATRWGGCDYRMGALGKWQASYVDTGSTASGPNKDGRYAWSITCVENEPTTSPGDPGPGGGSEVTQQDGMQTSP